MIGKSKYILGILLICFAASCSTPEKLLCRTAWKVADADFDEKKMAYDLGLKKDIIQQLKDSMLIVFKKDYTYRFKLPDRYETGTWRMNATKDTIFTNTEHTGAYTKINSLTREFLNVESHDRGGLDMKFICVPAKK